MALAHPFHIGPTGRTASPRDPAAHARQLLEQLLLTSPGERVMRPSFGGGVHQLVFAPTGDQAAAAAQHLISGAIQQWLAAWIELQAVDVRADDAAMVITVTYRLHETGAEERTELRIER